MILDYSGTEVSKRPATVFDFSSQIVFSLLEARFHSPPSFLGLNQQQTYRLNSNLRI